MEHITSNPSPSCMRMSLTTRSKLACCECARGVANAGRGFTKPSVALEIGLERSTHTGLVVNHEHGGVSAVQGNTVHADSASSLE